jgi:hypothetical protein
MRHPSSIVVGAAALAVLAGASCRREASQTEPARTTTEGGTTTAPASKDAAERDMTLVRAVNAVPAPAPADVYADEMKVFEGVAYKEVTPYKELQDNDVTFKLQLGDPPGQSVDEEKEMLLDGRHYTVMAMPGGRNQAPTLKVLADEITPPELGKVKIRVVNASPDDRDVAVVVSSQKDPIITGVGSADNTSYKEIEPYTGKLILRDEEKNAVVAEVPASLEAGKLYTVIVLGRTAGTPKAEALMVQDELAPSSSTSPREAPAAGASPKY